MAPSSGTRQPTPHTAHQLRHDFSRHWQAAAARWQQHGPPIITCFRRSVGATTIATACTREQHMQVVPFIRPLVIMLIAANVAATRLEVCAV